MGEKHITMISALALTLIVGLNLTGPAVAAEDGKSGKKQIQESEQEKMKKQKTDGGEQAKMKTGLISANRLIGQSVDNPDGKLLGEISNIIIDQKNNQAAYVEVSFGGILGIGEATRAVPFGALQMTETGYILDLSEERLSQFPQRQPGMTEEDFGRQIYRFFGRAPYWEKGGSEEKRKE